MSSEAFVTSRTLPVMWSASSRAEVQPEDGAGWSIDVSARQFPLGWQRQARARFARLQRDLQSHDLGLVRQLDLAIARTGRPLPASMTLGWVRAARLGSHSSLDDEVIGGLIDEMLAPLARPWGDLAAEDPGVRERLYRRGDLATAVLPSPSAVEQVSGVLETLPVPQFGSPPSGFSPLSRLRFDPNLPAVTSVIVSDVIDGSAGALLATLGIGYFAYVKVFYRVVDPVLDALGTVLADRVIRWDARSRKDE